jgi:dolichol-phosphate mannosyltransferase
MIAVILPTYNEAGNIEILLRKLHAVLPAGSLIIVVDDDSEDGTGEKVQELAKEINIHLISRTGQRGLGSALKDGINYALPQGKEFILTMDADLSHDPAVITQMIELGKQGQKIIIGSRYVDKGQNRNFLVRVWVSRISNFLIAELLGIPCLDSTSGFRMYSSSILTDFDMERLQGKGYSFQWEMLYLLSKQKFPIREIPIDFKKRYLGKSKFNIREIVVSTFILLKYAVKK